mmetsp:Transcript_51526/g.142645  ORF Transcript_51526/g.142645 Transcript_51526/m.142645 type:complete len:106 (-) Transcript_51526:37-354(-)
MKPSSSNEGMKKEQSKHLKRPLTGAGEGRRPATFDMPGRGSGWMFVMGKLQYPPATQQAARPTDSIVLNQMLVRAGRDCWQKSKRTQEIPSPDANHSADFCIGSH